MAYLQNMFSPKRLELLGRFNDLGAGVSRSNPFVFRDEAGILQYGKQGGAGHPFVVANEYVASHLANLVGIETANFSLHPHEGDFLYLSSDVGLPTARASGNGHLTSPLFQEEFARLLAFDLWIMNDDRHASNYMLRHEGSEAHVVAVDHDKALYAWGTASRYLEQQDLRPADTLVHSEIPRVLIQKRGLTLPLEAVFDMVGRVRALPSTDIEAVVRSLPSAVLPVDDKGQLARVLLSRRDRLGDLANALTSHALLRAAFV